MLDKHLIAKTAPLANKNNIVLFGDYRITVLSDRLFRIEKDAEKIFTDQATQSVWFRDLGEVEFVKKAFADRVEITTKCAKLVVNNDYEKSFIVLDKKKKKLSNDGNLLGTYRTLDGFDGDRYIYDRGGKLFTKIEFENGVCSKTGVAVLDDKKGLILDADGMLKSRREQEIDQYIFAFGHDYKGAVKALYDITGYTPKIPRYALGNWWSRYHVYTDTEYLNVLERFEENDIPLTVATIDMDWHYSDYVDEELKITETGHRDAKYGCANPGRSLGWTGYTWHKELFPDYKSFLKKIKDKNLVITLNLHPADGVRYYEDMYKEMCDAMGQDASEERPVEFDLTSDKFINNYFKVLHKPYENDGVGFWWIDWQQGTKSQMAGLDPLWALNHYHYLDNSLNHDNGLVLSRYCEAGSHRYPLGFSADTSMSFPTLNFLPYFTSTASNIGYTWWSHDIGGHHQGYTDHELFARFVEYGVFTPIMRLHSTANETISKEPWFIMNGAGEIMAKHLRYRHSLIPFIYSEGVKTHKYGKPLIEPIYYYYPENALAYKYKNSYYFGNLFIAPITSRATYRGYGKVKAWLPEGRWTDIFTGEEYIAKEGGREITFYRTLDSIPALAKAGTTLIRSGDKHTNSPDNPNKLIMEVYSGNGEYVLYEDDGVNEATTTVNNESDGKTLKTTISFKGHLSALPAGRSIRLQFKNVYSGKPVVTVDGEEIEVYTKCDNFVEVVIDDVDYNKTYVVTVSETPLSKLEMAQRQLTTAITKFEQMTWAKEDLYRLIMNKYWDKEENNLRDMKEPVFDGTKASLVKLMSEYDYSEHDKNGCICRKLLNDPIKEMKFNKVHIEKLCELLED